MIAQTDELCSGIEDDVEALSDSDIYLLNLVINIESNSFESRAGKSAANRSFSLEEYSAKACISLFDNVGDVIVLVSPQMLGEDDCIVDN